MPRSAIVAIFIVVALSVLFCINAVVYEAIVIAFSITGAVPLIGLGTGLGFLSVSFIGASILGSYRYNAFTRAFYWVAAVWLGILVYLMLASVIYIVAMAHWTLGPAVGPVLFGAVLVLVVYGVIHARNIVVTAVSVSLPNLPESWKGRRAVLISDIHLGQIYGSTRAQRISDAVMAQKPDIVFVVGDLYDGTSAPDIHELTAPLAKLVAPHGVYFVTGNHEEYGNLTTFLSAVSSAGMRVLQDELIDVDGLQLIGVDFNHAAEIGGFTKVLAGLPLDRSRVSILLKHEPKHLWVAEAAGISLQLSGHTHRAQIWPLEYIAQLSYKGYAYGLKQFKTMQVFTSSGVGTWGPPMRVGTDCEVVVMTFM